MAACESGRLSLPEGTRISHLILNMGLGGAETLVRAMALDLRSRGAAPNVICLDAVTDGALPLMRRGVPVELIKRRPGPFDLQACLRVARRLKNIGSHVIHAHDMTSLSYAVAAGLWLRRPVIMTEHSRHFIEARGLRRLEKRLLCLGVSRLVDVSRILARASRKDGVSPGKITVIENGVDVERFRRAGGERIRAELGLRADVLLVGMAGRLEPIKGPRTLLAAFLEAFGAHEWAHLAFAGSGSLRSVLEERARAAGAGERVHFLGARRDIPEIMAALDIVALPSLSEGLPLALLEAMASGRAVAASAVGAVPEILGTRRGVLVASGDQGMLARALMRLAADPARRARMGRAAFDFVSRRFSHEAMMDRYIAVYAQALTGKGPA